MAKAFSRVRTDDSRKEINPHGTVRFPVACYCNDLEKEYVPWHWHDELEAAVVVGDAASISYGKEKRNLCCGEGYFANAGTIHSFKRNGTKPGCIHSIVFHPRLIFGNVESVYWLEYVKPLITSNAFSGMYLDANIPWHSEALESISNAWEEFTEQKPGYEFRVRNWLSLLVERIVHLGMPASFTLNGRALRDAERIKAMLRFLQQNYGEDITLAQVAAAANISVSECLRCFRKTIGITPMYYLKTIRLQTASKLLATTDLSVSMVGEACGFQDMSYFAREFQRMFCHTPSSFRKAGKHT